MYSGKLLIATPSIVNDFHFHRTVVFLANHDDSGSFGFILNKEMDLRLSDVMENVNVKIPLYYGGPVGNDNLFFIHNMPSISGSEINEGLYYGGDYEMLIDKLNDNEISHHNVRFFKGYSGWSERQLKEEIDNQSWKVSDNVYKDKIICNNKSIWKEQMMALGGKYVLWTNMPNAPELN